MKTRIVNVENVIKKGFDKCRKFNSAVVVMGRYEEDLDEGNIIQINPIKKGGSVHSKSTLIETSMEDVRDIAELTIACLLNSKLKFNSISMQNMDGTRVDISNPLKSIQLNIIIKGNNND